MAIEYLKRRILTEKAGYQNLNKYVFEVDNLLTKSQIRQSVSELFNVNPKVIVAINTHRPPQKQKQQRSVVGKKIAVKRAIITLKKGETLTFTEPIE